MQLACIPLHEDAQRLRIPLAVEDEQLLVGARRELA
jgi:hypothetical protein